MSTVRIYYKPDADAIARLKPGPSYGIEAGDPIERAKTIACIYALKDHSNDPIDAVYTQMYWHLNDLAKLVRRYVRAEYYEEAKSNGEVSFEHHLGLFGDIDWDFNRTMSWKVKWFTEQAILCPTPDYYENAERFGAKESNLNEELDGFVESMEEVYLQEVEKELEPFKDREENEEHL